jgi:ABC-type Zn uptake system ZnuABC Zn-binding protein ZnuA
MKFIDFIRNSSLVILNGGGMEEGALAELLSQLPVAKRFVAIDVLATTDVANHDEHFFTDPRLALQVVIAMGKKFSEQFYRKLSQQNLSLLNKNVDRYKMNLQKIIDRQETIRQRIVRLPNRAAVTLSETLQQFLLSCGFDLKVLFWESEFHQPTTHQVLEAPKKIKELKVTFLFLEFGVESKYSQTLLAMHPMHLVTIDPMVRGPSDFSLDYYEQTMNKNFQAVESAIQLEVMRKL